MKLIGSRIDNNICIPNSDVSDAPFGKKFDGNNWLIFESQKEADQHGLIINNAQDKSAWWKNILQKFKRKK